MSTEEKEKPEDEELLKPLFWIAGSRDDLRNFPDEVKDLMGFALYQAQRTENEKSNKSPKGATK